MTERVHKRELKIVTSIACLTLLATCVPYVAGALAIGTCILTIRLWKYREGEVQSVRKRPLLWAIPGAIVLACAFVCATNALRDLFWYSLAGGILRELPPENCIGFTVEGSIAGIAFAVGRWLWPYRRLPLEQDAGGQP